MRTSALPLRETEVQNRDIVCLWLLLASSPLSPSISVSPHRKKHDQQSGGNRLTARSKKIKIKKREKEKEKKKSWGYQAALSFRQKTLSAFMLSLLQHCLFTRKLYLFTSLSAVVRGNCIRSYCMCPELGYTSSKASCALAIFVSSFPKKEFKKMYQTESRFPSLVTLLQK